MSQGLLQHEEKEHQLTLIDVNHKVLTSGNKSNNELEFIHTVLLSVVNSLAPGKFEQNFRQVIFKLISLTDGWGISGKIALRWMLLNLTDDKSTLVQVMAWCRQATSHYMSQCWPRSRHQAITWANVDIDLCRHMASYRPQWVKECNFPVPWRFTLWNDMTNLFCDAIYQSELHINW